MKRKWCFIFSIAFVILFIACDLERSVYHPEMSWDDQDDTLFPVEHHNVETKSLSEDPPRTPVNLSELVQELQAVTPLINQTDYDQDGLYDSVEAVIGTNIKNNDTDFDLLNDSFEALNGLDPLNPDSNDDGIGDYVEIDSMSLDLDSDSVPNVWDFDNDGDGVNDEPDLSPFATSELQDGFDISIQTTGDPTYIRFQIVPENPDHMKIVTQTWDWEVDSEGIMKDLDDSKEDVRVNAVLELRLPSGSIFPNETALELMGVVRTGDILEVSLLPVYESGSIIALSGQLLYMEPVALDLTAHAELKWNVIGQSDKEHLFLNCLRNPETGDNYLGVGEDMIAIGNVSRTEASEVEWIHIGEARGLDKVAIRLSDGPYLSWEGFKTLAFTGSEIGYYTTFYYHRTAHWVKAAYLGGYWDYVLVNQSGVLNTSRSDYTIFEKDISIQPIPTPLAQYHESFRFTGMTVEEYAGGIAGVFYTDNITEICAAAMVFTQDYSYNSTTTVHDMPEVLDWYGVNISSTISNVTDRYSASIVLSEVFIPAALSTLPTNKKLPLIIAIESYSRLTDLSEALIGTYILQDSCTISTGGGLTTTKIFDTNWYNTSSKIGITPWGIVTEILSWDWADTEKTNLIGLMIGWDAGINTITWAEDNPIIYAPDEEKLSRTQNILEIGLSSLDLAELASKILPGLEYLATTKFQDEYAALAAKTTKRLAKLCFKLKAQWFNAMNKLAKVIGSIKNSVVGAKFFAHFSKVTAAIGVLVDIGLSIWAGVAIAESIGGEVGKTIGTTYALVSAFIGIYVIAAISIALATFPILGWALLLAFLISDLTSGWTSKLAEYTTRAFYGNPVLSFITEPYNVIKSGPYEEFSDSDGLQVGDTITITMDVRGVVRGVDPPNDLYDIREDVFLRYSWNKPFIRLVVPTSIEPYVVTGYNTEPDDLNWAGGWPRDGEYWGDGVNWQEVTSDFSISASVSPVVAMNNYPVVVHIGSSYRIWQVTVRYPFFRRLFGKGPLVEETAIDDETGAYEITTLYYDVFPDSLDEFLSAYQPITQVDIDGDGLNSTMEALHGTSQWDYDSDGDRLNDGYEIEQGLNPTLADSDNDGVGDWYEYVYSLNTSNADSDNDSLSDYKEISGWTISFDYLNNQSLPFQIHVTSSPLTNDTDSDGNDDFTEYRCWTNPRSNDTNGDGIEDPIVEKITTLVTYEQAYESQQPIHVEASVYDLATDPDGNVYLSHNFGSDSIMGFDSDLNPTTNITVTPYYTVSPREIAYDENSSRLYISSWYTNWDYFPYTQVDNFTRFNTTGHMDPYEWGPYWIYGLDIDSEGNIYMARAWKDHITDLINMQVDVYNYDDGSLLLLDTMGSYGEDYDTFGNLWAAGALAVDEDRGYIYVCEPLRVAIWNLSDGSYIGDLPHTFQWISGIDVDRDGDIYVADQGNKSIRKFNKLGVEETDFKITTFGNTQFDEIIDIVVDSRKNIYVLDRNSSDFVKIVKFSQVVEPNSYFIPDTNPDWDGDGLTNVQELEGWEISVSFAHGEETFDVTSDPLMVDTDQDGLDDMLEFTLGSHPNSTDTDLDGVSDFEEWWLTTHPGEPYVPPTRTSFILASSIYSSFMNGASLGPSLTKWDTDGDLLGDSTELTFGSSPVNNDTDAEGLSDLMEFLLNSNPNSADSDGDGASDLDEFSSNSSLLDADSDNDWALDGVEYALGTNVSVGDNDEDGLSDGYEVFTGLDPRNNDSDGDGLEDAIEITLYIDPLNNDTDEDGILDGLEIEYGSNPLNNDTDWDGVPDALDSDTNFIWKGPIVLVYDVEPANSTLDFVLVLSEYTNVINTTVDEFLDNYTDYQYIVIVGQPDPSSTGLGGLVYNLLDDTGDVLERMMAPGSHEAAVRHGYWTDPQTIVVMSSAYESDLFPVLQMLRGWNISILSDRAVIEYNAHAILDNVTVAYASFVNEIDTVKTTDAMLALYFSGSTRPEITLIRYNATTTPQELSHETGLLEDDEAIGVYLDVSLILHDTTSSVFESALIRLFYRESNLDLTGNGQLGDEGDINETTLSLYHFDEDTNQWVKATVDLGWILSIHLNTTNIEIYGEIYAGYIQVMTTKLSLFALGGKLIGIETTFPDITLILILLGCVGLAMVVLFRKRRKSPSSKTPSKVPRKKIDDLIEDMRK